MAAPKKNVTSVSAKQPHGGGPRGGGGRRSFWRKHSLSLIAGSILLLWLVLYIPANPKTHAGSFFGNAIADWCGVVAMILATKHLYERGSREIRQPEHEPPEAWKRFIKEHSLTIFLAGTGLGWFYTFLRVSPEAKWGQVVGNILSEWVQIIGLVLLTKNFFETRSKE